MPTKAELYAQMADKVATQLTGSWQEWAGFLTTASRLYKYPFHEQLMIYAQRPDATACAEYDLWNEKMGRYPSLLHGLSYNGRQRVYAGKKFLLCNGIQYIWIQILHI